MAAHRPAVMACPMLPGRVSPIEASSGKVVRHRLNPGGNRQANAALWHIAVTRMSADQRTIDYVERRSKEGLTKKEIIRALKRTSPAKSTPT